MANNPNLANRQLSQVEWLIVNLVLVIFFVGVFTPATAGLAFVLERKWRFNTGQLGLMTVSFLWGLYAVSVAKPGDFYSWSHWVWSLPTVPFASGVLRGLYMFSHFMKPKSLDETLQEVQQHDELRRMKASRKATTEAVPGPILPELPDWLTLGVQQKGDSFPDFLKVRLVGRWLQLHQDVLDTHLFLLGATGAGKSETIKRLVVEIMANTDRHVYLVDGKGDEGLANDIRTLSAQYGRGQAPVFKLGFDETGAIYNGFRGSAEVIYNRLLALIGVEEMGGEAQYYADIIRTLLSYVCKSPQGPPRSFETLLTRLDESWLSKAYEGDAMVQAHLAGFSEKDWAGVRYRLIPLLFDFRRSVGEEGFALEDVACAIFSLRVQSLGDTARRYLDFLVEDLKDFVGKRQQQPGVLIIDEFGQFSNDNIISLLTLARAAKMGVILATQDTATLKDDTTRKIVLSNTRTKILMASDFPEEVAELAGTEYQIEPSMQFEDGLMTGSGSARVQHSFKIDMNEAAKLAPGEAFIFRQRHAAKVRITRIGDLEHVPPQKPEERQVADKGDADAAAPQTIVPDL